MSRNLLSNNAISESFMLREQVEKLTPIGKMYLENYKKVRVDEKTIELRKR